LARNWRARGAEGTPVLLARNSPLKSVPQLVTPTVYESAHSAREREDTGRAGTDRPPRHIRCTDGGERMIRRWRLAETA
jgi:hypothetical protein